MFKRKKIEELCREIDILKKELLEVKIKNGELDKQNKQSVEEYLKEKVRYAILVDKDMLGVHVYNDGRIEQNVKEIEFTSNAFELPILTIRK